MHLNRATSGQHGREGVFSQKNVAKVRSKLDALSHQLKHALEDKPFHLPCKEPQDMHFQPAHVIDLAEDGWIGKDFIVFCIVSADV